MDSGATATCLDKGGVELAERAHIPIYPFKSVKKTADGTPHPVVGRIRKLIELNKFEKEVEFVLVPTLGRVLYLGVDFMRSFKFCCH